MTATPIPGYCTSGTGIHTPAQWQYCWDLGWNEPTGTAAKVGYTTGHSVLPIVIFVFAVWALVKLAKMRSRAGSGATT